MTKPFDSTVKSTVDFLVPLNTYRVRNESIQMIGSWIGGIFELNFVGSMSFVIPGYVLDMCFTNKLTH